MLVVVLLFDITALTVAVPAACIVVLAIKLLACAAPVTFRVDVVELLLTTRLSTWLNPRLLNVLVVVLLFDITALTVAVPADCMVVLLVSDDTTASLLTFNVLVVELLLLIKESTVARPLLCIVVFDLMLLAVNSPAVLM